MSEEPEAVHDSLRLLSDNVCPVLFITSVRASENDCPDSCTPGINGLVCHVPHLMTTLDALPSFTIITTVPQTGFSMGYPDRE